MLGVGVLVVLLLTTVAGLRLAHPGVLPGVEIAGHDVSGLDEDELDRAVSRLGVERGEDEFTISLEADDTRSFVASRADLGYELDEAGTSKRAWRRGRQLNVLAALVDHLRAFGTGTIVVAMAESIATEELEATVAEAADALDADPVEGRITVDATEVASTPPVAGAVVDREGLLEKVDESALADGPQAIAAPNESIEPAIDQAAVEAAAEDARRAVSGAVRLHRDDAALELSGAEIGALLRVEPAEEGDELELVADPEALEVDDETIAALETDPVDAAITVTDGEVEIEPSADGFRFDHALAAEQALTVALADVGREAELQGLREEPERSTVDAEELEITERVSSFTTHHACCQGRVQNIQRMADLIDGVVLEPGETFSINDHVGRRTRDKGFTDGGVIIRGEFEQAVGGGVSQFATTFFGAAYEAGYEILDHQPHSYYISRYPAGREATLNYPTIDVVIRNDSPYGLLLNTRYSATAITVDFYGKDWVDVEHWTSNRYNVRQAPVEHEENSSLAPGQERVVQSGRQGFDINYTRSLSYRDGASDDQTWTHRYLPEPRIIERNSSTPEPEADNDPEVEGETPEDGGDEDDENGDTE